jgi:hypothetical protein
LLRDIDSICQAEGVYPHAFLSGHAHNYQRYTRTVHFNGEDYDVPFIVCGDGGHDVNALVQAKRLLLEHYDDRNFGYLRIRVDQPQLRIGFQRAGAGSPAQSTVDGVTVDLNSHTLVSN